MEGDLKPDCHQGVAVDTNSEGVKGDGCSVDVEANDGQPITWPTPLSTICSTSVLIFLMVIGILINSTSLAIGLNFINDCPAQDAIPVYLISSGVSGLVKAPFFAYFHIKTRDATSKKNVLLKRIYHLLIAIGVGLFIMGSLAVYQEFPSFRPSDDNYCNKVCYNYAFWFISCVNFCAFLVIFILITATLSGLLVFCFGCIERSMTKDPDQK